MPMIEIRGVSKWYGSFQVLTDCSSAVEKGEVVVVCGPSGSGKSTLMRALSGARPPDSGQIYVDGQPVSISNPRDAKALNIETIYPRL